MEGAHAQLGAWSAMTHGFAVVGARRDPAPRGVSEWFHTSMLMGRATRPVGGGWLKVEAMLSTEPFLGAEGYPLLMQTGETADGLTPLVDRQHPHDFIMGLGASWATEVEDEAWVMVYAAPIGAPAPTGTLRSRSRCSPVLGGEGR